MKKFTFSLCGFFIYALVLSTSPIKAADNPYLFPQDDFVRKQVWFWEMVFDRYDGGTTLIHDKTHPDVVIDVIDFKTYKDSKGRKATTNKKRKAVTRNFVKRYEKALRNFVRRGAEARNKGKIEQRIYEVYSQNKNALKNLLDGKAKLRTQVGLSDSFQIALKRAANYLPYMERIFMRADVPVELTRVPFVESMFHKAAESKVGATGMWQFMPYTAKKFMLVNGYIDERRSPLKATQAAARLMAHNYKLLGSWPLAITAYNHGVKGLKAGVKKYKTKNISTLIQHHKHKGFGFASKNFYAEFLAASRVYNRYRAVMRAKKQTNPLDIEAIQVGGKYNLSQLVNHTALTEEQIKEHNPCLLDQGFNRYQSRSLPKNYILFIPKKYAKSVRRSLSKLRYSQNNSFKKTELKK